MGERRAMNCRAEKMEQGAEAGRAVAGWSKMTQASPAGRICGPRVTS